MIILLYLYICISTLYAQLIFPDEPKPNTQQCVTKENKHGICKEFLQCPEARDEYLKGGSPTFCKLNKYSAGVCCVSKSILPKKSTAAPIKNYLEQFADTCGITSRVRERPFLALSRSRRSPLNLLPQTSVAVPLKLQGSDALKKIKDSKLSILDSFMKKYAKRSVEITGGEDALRNAWPWMALLGTSDGSWFCGGALISDKHIITAAHCFNTIPTPSIVRLGEHDVSRTHESNHIDLRGSTVIRHPRYNALRGLHDIAIVTLKQPVSFSQYIRPICLPNGSVTPESDKTIGTITGWGTTSFGGVSSNILQQVKVPIVNKKICENSYKSLGSNFYNTFPNGFPKELFCAAEESGGKDACQGDSGGPFMVRNRGRYTLEGVVSAGRGCGSADFPGLYMAVYPYLNWIKSKATV